MSRFSMWIKPEFFRTSVILVLSLMICLVVITRYQILYGFNLLTGDGLDGVISVTILEHWFRFSRGEVDWTNVQYYFPYSNTIANTDAFFLNGLAYIPFRVMGFDIFISSELSNLVIKAIGFFSAYLACRRMFSFTFYFALLAAVLFTLSNGMTVASHRIQLATVAFSPLLALLIYQAVTSFWGGNIARFRGYGIAAGIFFGAWCLTCFYMAWFFLFYAVVFVCVAILSVKDRSKIWDKVITYWASVLIVIASALVSLLPFLSAFVPKSVETGVRSYQEALVWTVPPEGILQVGTQNLSWGVLYNALLPYVSPQYKPFGEYYNTGFPILLFVFFVLGCIKVLGRPIMRNINGGNLLIWSLVITTISTWLLVLNIGGVSAWYFVFYLFPGAKALRVVAAYQLFLAFPVVVIAVRYLSLCRLRPWVGAVLCAFLLGEELNRPALALDRAAELKRIELPVRPPAECRAFYVSGWVGQEARGRVFDLYAHNVSAMLIAQFAGIPTINGIASFNPPGVDFSSPNRPDYEQRIYRYARDHRVIDLCKLDLNSKQWSLVKESDIEAASVEIPFFKPSALVNGITQVNGLSVFEKWGVWSVSNKVLFEFSRPLPSKFDLHLTARAFGPNIGRDFKVHVGDRVFTFKFDTHGNEEIVIPISSPGNARVLTIDVPVPTSPYSLTNGQSADTRNLGIGFVSMEIVPPRD
jgi:hypothetical protein